MELVDGKPLSQLLVGGRPLDPEQARALVTQAADALGVAHAAGVVHRDVKPANLMVTDAGVVKITDFGIARAADQVAITQTGQIIGTPHYLSPEQASGETATAGQRRLRARRTPLRVPGRAAPLRRRHPGGDRPGPHPRRRAATARGDPHRPRRR